MATETETAAELALAIELGREPAEAEAAPSAPVEHEVATVRGAPAGAWSAPTLGRFESAHLAWKGIAAVTEMFLEELDELQHEPHPRKRAAAFDEQPARLHAHVKSWRATAAELRAEVARADEAREKKWLARSGPDPDRRLIFDLLAAMDAGERTGVLMDAASRGDARIIEAALTLPSLAFDLPDETRQAIEDTYRRATAPDELAEAEGMLRAAEDIEQTATAASRTVMQARKSATWQRAAG